MDEILYPYKAELDRLIAKEILSAPTKLFPLQGKICGTRIVDEINRMKGMQVIFNAPTTILIIGSKKYISRAHDEEFDEEKGLLMCLAKASGYTHANLKKLLANAQRQTKKK